MGPDTNFDVKLYFNDCSGSNSMTIMTLTSMLLKQTQIELRSCAFHKRRPEIIAAVSFTSLLTHVLEREREPRKQIKAERIISKQNIACK